MDKPAFSTVYEDGTGVSLTGVLSSDTDSIQANLSGIGNETASSFIDSYDIRSSDIGTVVVIGYTDLLPVYVNGEATDVKTNVYLELDVISSMTVRLQGDMTDYPLSSYDFVMDHMYIQPFTMTVSGKFTTRGPRAELDMKSDSQLRMTADNSFVTYTDGQSITMSNRLRQKQETFEKIMKNGMLVTVNVMDMKSEIFKSRPCMAITNINWTIENPECLSFTMNLKNVRLGQLNEINYLTDKYDDSLPNTSALEKLDFVETYVDVYFLLGEIIGYIISTGDMSRQYLEYAMKNVLPNAGGSLSKTNEAMTAGLNAIMSIVNSVDNASSNGDTEEAFVTLMSFIGKMASYFENLAFFKEYGFNIVDDENIQHRIDSDFVSFVTTFMDGLSSINDTILAYGITENEDQKATVTVNNKNYTFSFVRNTSSISSDDKWMIEIEKEQMGGGSSISSSTTVFSKSVVMPFRSIEEVSDSGNLFKNDTSTIKSYCYFVLDKKRLEMIDESSSFAEKEIENLHYTSRIIDGQAVIQDPTAQYTYEQLVEMVNSSTEEAKYSDLRNYTLVISSMSLEKQFNNLLNSLVFGGDLQ